MVRCVESLKLLATEFRRPPKITEIAQNTSWCHRPKIEGKCRRRIQNLSRI